MNKKMITTIIMLTLIMLLTGCLKNDCTTSVYKDEYTDMKTTVCDNGKDITMKSVIKTEDAGNDFLNMDDFMLSVYSLPCQMKGHHNETTGKTITEVNIKINGEELC